MSIDVYINCQAVAFPECLQTVEASAAAGLTKTDALTLRASGFGHHRVACAGASCDELARRAVGDLGSAIMGVTTIVYATVLPSNANLAHQGAFEQSRDIRDVARYPASRLQADLDLGQASVIGLTQQATTGMLGAIRIARALLVAEPSQSRILCVVADLVPPGALYEQSFSLLSDGASACVVSREPGGYRLVANHAITIGALLDASDDQIAGTHFGFCNRIITETLVVAGLSIQEIDWIVPQNTSPKVWQILARSLGFPLERVVRWTVADVGHVLGSDNLVNLQALEATGQLKSGDRLLLFMASFGMNWQGLILEKV